MGIPLQSPPFFRNPRISHNRNCTGVSTSDIPEESSLRPDQKSVGPRSGTEAKETVRFFNVNQNRDSVQNFGKKGFNWVAMRRVLHRFGTPSWGTIPRIPGGGVRGLSKKNFFSKGLLLKRVFLHFSFLQFKPERLL